MNSQRPLTRAASALSALGALTVLVGGVPLGLAVAVGWPLPRGLPSLSEFAAALNGQTIDDTVLVKAIAVVCWLAWAQFITCFAAETIGWRRGRGARRVPLAGNLQPLTAKLLMTAAMIVHVFPRPSSDSPVHFYAAPIVHVTDVATAPAALIAAPSDNTEPQPSFRYTVQPRDDLWSLAETHLGDGHRWRELFDLNKGRPQPRGDALRRPNLIRPGWVLEFPPDAVGLTAMPAAEDDGASAETAGTTTGPEAHPPTSAEDQRSTTARCSTDAPAPEPPVVTPTLPPPTDAESQPPEAAPTPAAELPLATPQPASTGKETGSRATEVIVGTLGAGLLATGLVATIDRLRRAQQRRRPAGRTVRMPPEEAVPTEITIRRAASTSSADRLDLALRAFAGCASSRRRGDPPAVSTVQVGDAGVEILLHAPLDAPEGPFTLDAGGQVWTLSPKVPDEMLIEAAGDLGAPLPSLVSVGTLGTTRVLIDLEASGTTALIGAPEMVHEGFRTLALELATSTWADTLNVVLVSQDSEALAPLDRVQVVAPLSEVLPDLETSAGALSDALVSASAPTTFAARLGPNAADGWIPTVVLCADPEADAEATAHLAALAGAGGRGLAVVTVGQIHGAGRTLRFERDIVEVAPPGVTLSSNGLTAKQLTHVDEILTAAADTSGVDREEPSAEADTTLASVLDGPFKENDFDILVRLLGPVEIEGAKEPIDRRRAVELVAYLATHPRGLDDEHLKTALWPDERAPQSSFNTTVTKARSKLGTATDGSHHLPHVIANGGIYRLSARVTTDFALLERHLAAARRSTPDLAIRILRNGLELVRGLPFAGVRQGYEWAHAEGLIARMETVVAEAAHHLAELALENRDAELAQWAACQGLRASPGDEVLYRDRMLACDLAGNPAGVEAVMDELVAAVEAVEPYDTLHPETVALYERLSHRKRRTG